VLRQADPLLQNSEGHVHPDKPRANFSDPRRYLHRAEVTWKGGIVSQVDLDLATFNKRLAVLGLKPKSVERTRQALAELTVEMIECCPGVTMSPDSTFYVKGVLLALLDRAAEFEPMEKGRPQ
jgi:hypothetical protein